MPASRGTLSAEEEAVLGRLGERLREFRTAAELSQSELGRRTGVHRTYINQIEQGARAPGVLILVRISQELGTSLSQLVAGVDCSGR